MEAKDLRIGNLAAMYKGDVFILKARDLVDLDMGNGLLNCEPIPLTEDWLLKFGLKFSGYNMEDKAIYKIDDEVWIVQNIVTKQFYLNEYERELKHVHQLQNLYHSLTGEELI